MAGEREEAQRGIWNEGDQARKNITPLCIRARMRTIRHLIIAQDKMMKGIEKIFRRLGRRFWHSNNLSFRVIRAFEERPTDRLDRGLWRRCADDEF